MLQSDSEITRKGIAGSLLPWINTRNGWKGFTVEIYLKRLYILHLRALGLHCPDKYLPCVEETGEIPAILTTYITYDICRTAILVGL